jgi:hypothetical protein
MKSQYTLARTNWGHRSDLLQARDEEHSHARNGRKFLIDRGLMNPKILQEVKLGLCDHIKCPPPIVP